MKKVLLIGGAVALAYVALKYVSGQNVFVPQQNNTPKNYLDSYWQNLKERFGGLF